MGKQQATVNDIIIYTGDSCKYAKKGDIWQPSKVCSVIDGAYFKNWDINTDSYRFATENEVKWFKLGITNISQIPYVGMKYIYLHKLSDDKRIITSLTNTTIYNNVGNIYNESFASLVVNGEIQIINNNSNINKNESSETIKLQGEINAESSRKIEGKHPIFSRQKQTTNGSRPVGNKIAVKIKGARVRAGIIKRRNVIT